MLGTLVAVFIAMGEKGHAGKGREVAVSESSMLICANLNSAHLQIITLDAHMTSLAAAEVY